MRVLLESTEDPTKKFRFHGNVVRNGVGWERREKLQVERSKGWLRGDSSLTTFKDASTSFQEDDWLVLELFFVVEKRSKDTTVSEQSLVPVHVIGYERERDRAKWTPSSDLFKCVRCPNHDTEQFSQTETLESLKQRLCSEYGEGSCPTFWLCGNDARGARKAIVQLDQLSEAELCVGDLAIASYGKSTVILYIDRAWEETSETRSSSPGDDYSVGAGDAAGADGPLSNLIGNRYKLTEKAITPAGIFAASDVQTDRKVGLKMFEEFSDFDECRRFHRDFNSPHVCKVLDPDGVKRGAYFCLAFERGDCTLADLKTAAESDYCRKMLTEMLRALKFIHGSRTLHGSLKPSNIMFFSESFSWKLLLSDVHPPERPRKSYFEERVGIETQFYSEKDDVYSLGIVALDVLTHKSSVTSLDNIEDMDEEDIQRRLQRVKDNHLHKVLKGMTCKHPESRQTAAAALALLEGNDNSDGNWWTCTVGMLKRCLVSPCHN